jgi:surface carbohydrate biosynthesis protein
LHASSRVPLIIPVEIQVRELDAKLLLACVAARRGFPVVIGRLKSIMAQILSFPPSVFVSKGTGARSVEKFQLLRGLGHEIAGWDEEALVHLPPDVHFAKRVSPIAGQNISHLFAWGPESADLWRRSPQFQHTHIHVTGNPRVDLLRPEIRSYFEPEVRELRKTYGDYVLINTNFPLVNSNRGLFETEPAPGRMPALGRGALGMTREFAERLYRHKHANWLRFQRLVPELERAFPEVKIVIRPHPSEKPEVYHRIAGECPRVVVVGDGSVNPWLMASRATIHNGCTTGVESNLMGVPTLTYGPTRDETFDLGRAFFLPNLLSHQCPDFESLRQTLGRILGGELGCAGGEDRRKLIAEFFAPLDGPLASERIVSALESSIDGREQLPSPQLADRLGARRRIHLAQLKKMLAPIADFASRKRASKKRGARKSVYPEVTIEQMRERVDRFQRALGHTEPLTVEASGKHIYRIGR